MAIQAQTDLDAHSNAVLIQSIKLNFPPRPL